MSARNEYLVEALIRDFDFQRVHQAMVALGWDWVDSEGVPSIAEMKQTARDLCHTAIKEGMCSSGGFLAEFKDEHLSLKFVIEEQETE